MQKLIKYAFACMAAILLYVAVVRSFFYRSLIDKTGLFYDFLIEIYPRIKSESYRFTTEFLLQKADGLVLKITLLTGGYFFLSAHKKGLLHLVCGQRLSQTSIAVFYSLILLNVADSYKNLTFLTKISSFFQPFSFFMAMPDENTLFIVAIIVFMSGLMVIFEIQRFWASIIFALFIIFQEGLFFGFGKINHHYAPAMYAVLVFPAYFLLPQSKLTIFFLKLVVSLPYTLAGLEKLLSEPLFWLGSVERMLVLLWQVSFVWGVFNFKWLYHGFGLFFHAAVAIQLGIGFYVHPWQIGYVLFYDRKSISNLRAIVEKNVVGVR